MLVRERRQTVVLRAKQESDADSCNGCKRGDKVITVLEIANGQTGFEWRMCPACAVEFRRAVTPGKEWDEMGQHI